MLLEELSYEVLVIRNDVQKGATLKVGENLSVGAVLGRVTASGLLVLADDTATDGSEVPFAILLEDCDATDGDRECPIMLAGIVNEGALGFGGDFDADGVRDALRGSGIYLQTVMGA